MAFTDDYRQRKRKYEIQNLKRDIELDMEYDLKVDNEFARRREVKRLNSRG